MKKILILLTLLLVNSHIEAQSPQDSLFNIWQDELQPDTVRLNALNEYFYAFRVRPDTMLSLANRMYDLATSTSSKRYEVDAVIQQARAYGNMGDLEKSLTAVIHASELAEEIGYHYGEVRSLILIGYLKIWLGEPTQSIEYFTRSYEVAKITQTVRADSSIFGEIKSWQLRRQVIEEHHNRLGNTYRDMGAYVQALEHYKIALKENLVFDNKLNLAAVQNNIALVHMKMEENDKAMDYFGQALLVFEELGHKEYQANVFGNMASIYLANKSYKEAEDYMNRNLKVREEIGNPQGIGRAYLSLTHLNLEMEDYVKALAYADMAEEIFSSDNARMEMIYINIYRGDIYMKQGKLNASLLFFEKSLQGANEMQSLNLRKDAIDYLYQVNKKLGQEGKALNYHEELLSLNDSLNKDETGKKLLQVEFAEKILTDSLLQVEEKMRVNLAHEKEILEETNTRNIFMASGLILLIVSGGLWNRLIFTRKSRKIIEKEKDRSENLLLNILPAEVAEELKENGEAKARDFDMVTLIFTDFKEFTQTSEKLTANELVDELNYCFKGFDGIMEKYGIEKIKTIGDAYMAVGGLHDPADEAAIKTTLAALEMQEFVITRKKEQDSQGLMAFEMRLGMHSGPVVAGIVGVKKFQYDIWGDTVNTASRLESSGEVDKVNISQATYKLIRGETGFSFTKRGKVVVKGKGELDMYFVSS